MSDIGEIIVNGPDELWRTHVDELLGFATVLVGPTDAYDIVVEAFLRAQPRIAAGTVADVRAYLFRAVTNHAQDSWRSQKRRLVRDLAAIRPVSVAAPDSFVDVRRAVANLSVQQRAVVYLSYWEDLTEREIGVVLDISQGTVRRHLTRARFNLRKALR